MKKYILSFATIAMAASLSGCMGTSTPSPTPDLTQIKATNKAGEEVLVMTDGTKKMVQNKTANIKGEAKFDEIEGSTLSFSEGISEVSGFIKSSNITIKKDGVLKTPYLKNSTIIVEEGADLQVSERVKESKIILKGGTFSVRPSDIDEATTITQE